MTDPEIHKRYLEYRDRHVYFGKLLKQLTMAEFIPLDAEHRVLDAKGSEGDGRRDDEEEARFEELGALLFRD